MSDTIIIPPPMQEGDRIAILSPSGIVKPDNVYNAMPILKDWGWEPYVCHHTFDRYGTYAGKPADRFADLRDAFTDPSTRAIMCSRGGYGLVHLLEDLEGIDVRKDPKWVIGFSDITVLHCFLVSKGVASIHSHMTSHLANNNGEDDDSIALYDVLNGFPLNYEFATHKYNRQGRVRGKLVGGNLSCLAGLIGTPYDIMKPGTILFIEDVSEPVYKIERIMYQLRLSGVLANLKGLVVGRFTKTSTDLDGETMESMIHRLISPYDFPVAFNAPIGHVSHNLPLIEGIATTLDVSEDTVMLDQRDEGA